MLTEKDYCDYDTCVALRELGFSEPTFAYYHGFLSSKPLLYLVINEDYMPEGGVNVFDLLSNSNKYKDSKNIDAPTLWEAQKWLREEKNTIVEANFNLMHEGQPRFSWRVLYNLTQHKGAYYTFDSVKSKEDYDSFEEAFSEGILTAVEILKEED